MLMQKLEILSQKKTIRKVKVTAGMSMRGERIKVIDKNNNHADCTMCAVEEAWEHAAMCNQNKQTKDEWTQNARKF